MLERVETEQHTDLVYMSERRDIETVGRGPGPICVNRPQTQTINRVKLREPSARGWLFSSARNNVHFARTLLVTSMGKELSLAHTHNVSGSNGLVNSRRQLQPWCPGRQQRSHKRQASGLWRLEGEQARGTRPARWADGSEVRSGNPSHPIPLLPGSGLFCK